MCALVYENKQVRFARPELHSRSRVSFEFVFGAPQYNFFLELLRYFLNWDLRTILEQINKALINFQTVKLYLESKFFARA